MADKVQAGDKVSWNWNGNKPSGTVGEVKAGEVTVTSHRGNDISKTGDEDDPAVHIERSGNDVVKKASELTVEDKNASAHPVAAGDKDSEGQKDEGNQLTATSTTEQNGNDAVNKKDPGPKTGDKRTAHEMLDVGDKTFQEKNAGHKHFVEEKEKEDEPNANKKQKTASASTNGASNNNITNGVKKKGPGRPKTTTSNGEMKKAAAAPKKERKVLAVGRSERKTRSQGAA